MAGPPEVSSDYQEPRRVAVVLSPEPLVRDALVETLSRIDCVVGATPSGAAEAVEAISESLPDLLVVHICAQLPEHEAFACIRQVRSGSRSLRAIAVGSRASAEIVRAAFDAGADAYIVLTADWDDVAMAVRQTFQRSVYFSAATTASTSETDLPLTGREREILRLVAEGHSNREIARSLWVAEQTVKFHLTNIYRKLGLTNRTEASRWAHLNGLVPGDDAPLQ